ncbi:MAG: recombinase family protein [Bacteriovoracaceae bacterium]|jgi:DNA invertase Pin-like site-specific DNA recombinase|nr:recombinase family protein [Bacteriovoracaceae bacterium]
MKEFMVKNLSPNKELLISNYLSGDYHNDKREVFIYLRVSTQQQSVDSQSAAIQVYCKQKGIEKYKIFQDEGISGAKVSRPALDEMMNQIKDGKAKHLIVFSFSRFSRSCSHLLKSLEFLDQNKCLFTSVSEQIETSTIMGRTLVAVLGALAQMERELVVQRVKAGLNRARLAGKHIGRRKTRPSEMIRKLLIRGTTYKEASHFCKTSQGSICLEAKAMRKEFEEGRLPDFLTLDDLRQSKFFSNYSREDIERVIASTLELRSRDVPPPLPSVEPIAKVSTVTFKQAA